MCGLAGVARREQRGVELALLRRMAAAVRHRGPDGEGFSAGARVGLAHLRLSIVDIEGGAQPMTNEDGRIVVVFTGEIFNHVELRAELASRGHRFRTHCDTEVLVHGWEEWGRALPERLNGEFVFAIHDRASDALFIARDRFGVRPLFYAEREGDLHFGSEAKALFAGEIRPEPDLEGLDEVFTFWAARPPRTVFRGVRSLEPGCWLAWRDGTLTEGRYYSLEYPAAGRLPGDEPPGAADELRALLDDAVRLRLRADVPVGAYLSGGLDSSTLSALAARRSPYRLRSFAITFEDAALDEGAQQRSVAEALGTHHLVQAIGPGDIAGVLPDVVRHAECPFVRTAPAPMYLLARLARGNGIKVALTGEGADELFLGYDLFKETAIRRFCERRPLSRLRPRLFDRLYPYLDHRGRGGEFWRRYFLDASDPADPLYSHAPRFALTSRIKELYSSDVRESLAAFDARQELRESLPAAFRQWDALHQAAYLEMTTLLSPYLLASQGDRVAMAHAVEGRFPFLDHRIFEFAASLPVGSKLRGLREKEILRRAAAPLLPPGVAARRKQPYRAPDAAALFGPGAPPWVDELLAPDALRTAGLFDPLRVAGLLRRCREGRVAGFRENQALVAVLTSQLWHREFLAR